ncbi:hypothetical protein MM221_17355 [Salipaludibacillus sp. LMS25]|jgi:hypothetical protein|uniref:hypothetical protein n=1 Tax=Salipaludibacillus sp. LMS25 TaxID=2924031 RepID=UPI0020D0736E|nr:hypothetical protein [Salipaludibacillus sp. LMS25]UTR14309.1 hypothetical protein MM221_17355 [Salipaludibacillus sp. LMS25]
MKIASIDGISPSIESENLKMARFALHNRKISPYIPKNEPSSAFNRKISAYFTLTNNSIIDKASYLKIKGEQVYKTNLQSVGVFALLPLIVS